MTNVENVAKYDRRTLLRCVALAAVSAYISGPASTLASEPTGPQISLVYCAGAARYRLTANVDLLLAGFDPDSQDVLDKALRPGGDRSADGLWPQLASGALQVRHQDGEIGETLWFNPIFDAGLLIRWRRVAGDWAVTDAWWVLGSDIRPAEATAVKIDDADPRALAVSSTLTFRTAAAAGWRAPLDNGANKEVAQRIAAAATSVAILKASDGYGDAVWATQQVLAYGAPLASGPDADLSAVLADFGKAAQDSLRPAAAHHHENSWTLVMQSPDAPGGAWFVRLESSDTKTAIVTDATFVRYTHQGVAP